MLVSGRVPLRELTYSCLYGRGKSSIPYHLSGGDILVSGSVFFFVPLIGRSRRQFRPYGREKEKRKKQVDQFVIKFQS